MDCSFGRRCTKGHGRKEVSSLLESTRDKIVDYENPH